MRNWKSELALEEMAASGWSEEPVSKVKYEWQFVITNINAQGNIEIGIRTSIGVQSEIGTEPAMKPELTTTSIEMNYYVHLSDFTHSSHYHKN
ncbi:hypothetical protein EVAR_49794_1 [Eumeta japonica]|uniref:Uncharacterized protein n=1 Tax=Eumeta variegata TaxID=151549 RepID=A0A4C1YX17_EUMVA|nr:hypothetical protein EVAR_49794_1 [Eumeta japonica]